MFVQKRGLPVQICKIQGGYTARPLLLAEYQWQNNSALYNCKLPSRRKPLVSEQTSQTYLEGGVVLKAAKV